MTIEIHRPELEALIQEWMRSGTFQNVEDVLVQALRSSPLSAEKDARLPDDASSPTGAALVAVMRDSPYKEICLEPTRDRLPVRDVVF